MTSVLRGDALHLPLADASVDLIITSPPYFALRSYQDAGEHYPGQLGSEATPQQFLEALWAVTAECWRVLKPIGSMFVNLGDKASQRVAARLSSYQDGLFPDRPELKKDWKRDREAGLARMPADNLIDTPTGARAPREKSLMGLPWRYALGCIDGAADPAGDGWILRSEIIWDKPNGMPESVKDRVRRSHEQFFHFTKAPRYYSAVDEIREPHASDESRAGERALAGQQTIRPSGPNSGAYHTLGRLPGSVWQIASEPLLVPAELGVDHFAAFPTEWPRRLVLGWSPPAICCACGQGRVPVTEKTPMVVKASDRREHAQSTGGAGRTATGGTMVQAPSSAIVGYACACTPYTDHEPAGERVERHTKSGGYAGKVSELDVAYCAECHWQCRISSAWYIGLLTAVQDALADASTDAPLLHLWEARPAGNGDSHGQEWRVINPVGIFVATFHGADAEQNAIDYANYQNGDD